ncbi:MAG: hypothetical protein AAB074_03185 [Planctomycetota bacterium]
MGNYSYLRATDHSGPSADMDGVDVASSKYSLPIGWMIAFDASELIEVPEAEEDYPGAIYRASRLHAIERLSNAISVLRADEYLWWIFRHLEGLHAEVSAAKAEFLEADPREVFLMGEEGGDFDVQSRKAPGTLSEFLNRMRSGQRPLALDAVNSLCELSGMKLTGSRASDEVAWTGDMQVMGIPDSEALCRFWVRGVLASE